MVGSKSNILPILPTGDMWQVASTQPLPPSMAQEEMYTLYCFVLGEDTAFPVEVAKRETVGNLRDKIKEKKKPDLDLIAANNLNLYCVPVTDDDELANLRLETLGPLLKARDLLSRIFSNPEDVTVIVQLPDESYEGSASELCTVDIGGCVLITTFPLIKPLMRSNANARTLSQSWSSKPAEKENFRLPSIRFKRPTLTLHYYLTLSRSLQKIWAKLETL